MYKLIVLSDMQVPYHSKPALAAIEKYMADEKFDEWLQIGDFMDFHQLAKFTESVPEALTHSLRKDYDVANEILDRHQSIIRKRNPKAKFTLLCGNHEDRVRKFAERNPQTKGIIDVDINLRLKERGIKFVRCYPDGEVYKLGKAYFVHGLFTGQNHAKKHVDSFGVNIFYGHTHQTQSHSKVMWGKNRTLIGESLGCLCNYSLDYVGKNPTSWQHAFAVFYFTPDGFFNHYVVRIFNGRFTGPNGKVYQG